MSLIKSLAIVGRLLVIVAAATAFVACAPILIGSPVAIGLGFIFAVLAISILSRLAVERFPRIGAANFFCMALILFVVGFMVMILPQLSRSLSETLVKPLLVAAVMSLIGGLLQGLADCAGT